MKATDTQNLEPGDRVLVNMGFKTVKNITTMELDLLSIRFTDGSRILANRYSEVLVKEVTA